MKFFSMLKSTQAAYVEISMPLSVFLVALILHQIISVSCAEKVMFDLRNHQMGLLRGLDGILLLVRILVWILVRILEILVVVETVKSHI